MTDECEYEKEKLLDLLKKIVIAIENNTLPEFAQKDIWEALTWDKKDPDNQDVIKYLFTGYWIYFIMNSNKINEEHSSD